MLSAVGAGAQGEVKEGGGQVVEGRLMVSEEGGGDGGEHNDGTTTRGARLPAPSKICTRELPLAEVADSDGGGPTFSRRPRGAGVQGPAPTTIRTGPPRRPAGV